MQATSSDGVYRLVACIAFTLSEIMLFFYIVENKISICLSICPIKD